MRYTTGSYARPWMQLAITLFCEDFFRHLIPLLSLHYLRTIPVV